MTFPVLFPVKFKIFLVALAPIERALSACLFPRTILCLLVLEIVGVLPPPGAHIFQLAPVLAFERRADGLIRTVFIGQERLITNTARSFFWHMLSSLI